MIVLLRSTDGQAADSDAVQDKVDAALAAVADNESVDNVITYRTAGNDERFVSNDGTATYAIVLLEATDEESIDLVDDIRADIAPQEGLSYQLTGYGPLAENTAAIEHFRKSGIVFTNLRPGRYAVVALHDENGNGYLDKNFVGFPTEPYGFSNGAEGFLGPPSFSDAAMAIGAGDSAIRIELILP